MLDECHPCSVLMIVGQLRTAQKHKGAMPDLMRLFCKGRSLHGLKDFLCRSSSCGRGLVLQETSHATMSDAYTTMKSCLWHITPVV